MTTMQEKLLRFLLSETEGLGRVEAIGRLMELGVVSQCGCERAAIRTDVDRLVRRGSPRCEAMEDAAVRFRCSYAKVRGAVYYKPKK